MSVDPMKSQALPQPDAGRLGAGQAARRSGQHSAIDDKAGDHAAPPRDSVELSAASLKLVEPADEAAAVPQGTLSPERAREVLHRLETDHYKTPDVRDTIARAIRKDLGLSPSE